MNIEFAPRALTSIRYRNGWWRTYRDKAPRLFGYELRAALDKIREGRDVARKRYSGDGDATVWRLLLPKTRHHVYYQRDERTDVAFVVLVDSAVGETGPNL